MDCSMEVESQLPVFPDSSKPIVNVWKEKFEKGILSYTHFKEHWRLWVPQIFSPEPNNSCLDWSFDEKKAQQVLFDTLEEFICDGEPRVVLPSLMTLDSLPFVCGRVFKMGEPTYNCRECGMDATCVLCVDCFKRSEHRHHKYKMGTSSGGGCCDCGDTEAWKKAPYCDYHEFNGREKRKDNTSVLPKHIEERVRVTFSAVLRYAYQLLTLEDAPGLPADLCLKEANEDPLNFPDIPDNYCTVLYNDETHTFEQVISTLARVIKCSNRDAIEFVTNIDREGRAVVKCSTFQHCSELRTEIERFTSRHGNRALKVLVVNAHVVGHQLFALRLLSWLHRIFMYSLGFRIIFSEVALQSKTGSEVAIVEGILGKDCSLWKSARFHWHRLFISGLLMEYESKKSFAKVFTKMYGSIMKEFIKDDHDHSFSVASLAVQVFTVPTIAHYLIAHENVLFMLMNTFISECTRKLNKAQKLEFERNVPNGNFKRAQYILYDLRYLLGVMPETWTDDLRKGFLHGVSLILNLLTYMQGMDAVTRQVGQHMEYEPEWESAFNLHIKLSPVITLIQQWCGTDRVVLIKAYRLTLNKLHEFPSFDTSQVGEVRELADHSAACLQYDVSTQPVSIHLPLSRFLAGLHLHLEKFGLSFDSKEIQMITKQSPQQLIEPVLRTQVMISQVHANMWRRNGYSLLNQLFFYHNVKCRAEMLDKDIVLLQIGASLIESNEFLIHLLNKFNLFNWANPQFEVNSLKNPEEDSIRQTIGLVEEFLTLLVIVVGERYNPGVGQVTHDDCIKKEIIQQLCIKPLPHSELNKTLLDDVNHETGMESVIHDVAVFKKPTQPSGKGVYELKPEFYEQYNVFFYHYTREELSKSEEVQRKRRKQAGELECCPPPPLPPLTAAFSMMANLLQCDVMLHIMHIVLERSVNLRARSFSEAQLHKILHLIGYALQEEEREQCQFLQFSERAEKWQLEQLVEELCSSARVEAHKDLLTWTMGKFRQVAAPRRKVPVTVVEPIAESSSSAAGDESAKEEKEWRAKMAAEKRAKIMAQMSAMQKSFMKENATLFEATMTYPEKNYETRDSKMDLSEPLDETRICIGPNQTLRLTEERTYTCILCQEDQQISADEPALVLAAFVQKSTVMSRNRIVRDYKDYNEDNKDDESQLFLSSNISPAPHTSTCGHVMHSQCWQRYFDNVLAKETRRPYRLRHPSSFDVEKNEFLCPLCECLNNTVLPLVPPLADLVQSGHSVDINFDSWLQGMLYAVKQKQRLVKGNMNKSSSDTPAALKLPGTPSQSSKKKPHKSKSASESSAPSSNEEQPSQSNPLQLSTLFSQATSSQAHIPPAIMEEESTDDNSSEDSPTDIFSQLDDDNDDDEPPPATSSYEITESDIVMELSLYQTQAQESDVPLTPPTCLSEKLLDMIFIFAQCTYTKGLGVNPSFDKRVPLLVWNSCAYTIHSLERLMRSMDKPLFGDLSCRQQDCIQGLTRIAGILVATWKQEQVINNHAMVMLSVILDNPSTGPCILDWDSFGALVSLSMSLPSLYCTEQHSTPLPTGSILELHTLTLMFFSNLVQILISGTIEESPMEEAEMDPRLVELYKAIRLTQPVSQKSWETIENKSIPFLRCCALFYHFLTDVPAPDVLTEVGGDTFNNLCAYLGLPSTCSELLDHTGFLPLVKRWVAHPKVKSMCEKVVQNEMIINQLVELPDDYSELINTVSLFTCPNSVREDSRNPTMCLVCGEMLCSQSYCCQTELNKTLVGACTYHAHTCGAGAGIFMRVRECEVLLLASPSRGCFMTPPYLDAYGETDQGLRRGNPLRLCHERYRRLQLLWLGHGIHEEIARALESTNSHINTQWQHL